jgi:hypothetical protein
VKPNQPQAPRFVEATQFTIQDYDLFKAGTTFDNKFRQAAMQMMAEDEKDQKSELSKIGLSEVKRIRVLRESTDTEGKSLKLVYETKSDKREIERRAFEAEQKRQADIRYTYPVWISDAKEYFRQLFAEHVDWIDNRSSIHDPFGNEPDPRKKIAEALEVIGKKVNESRLDRLTLQEARVEVYKLLNSYTARMALPPKPVGEDAVFTEEWPKEKFEKYEAMNESRQELFLRLDFVTAALRFIGTALFDKSSFLEYARKLEPRHPPKYQNQRPNKPQGQQSQEATGPSKTKLQKQQNRQHRQPKGAEEKKPQPQA